MVIVLIPASLLKHPHAMKITASIVARKNCLKTRTGAVAVIAGPGPQQRAWTQLGAPGSEYNFDGICISAGVSDRRLKNCESGLAAVPYGRSSEASMHSESVERI